MLLKWNAFSSGPLNAIHPFILVLLGIVYACIPATAIVAVPSSNCYTFDSDSHLVDFTHMVGTNFEYNEKGSIPTDLVVQLCKDVQRRSQAGFIDFGRFTSPLSFLTGSKPVDYIQKFQNGDLAKCETTFEEMGRTAQVNPTKGLGVMLTGSGANGAKPTVLSPTVLNVNWICEITRSSPYEVNVSIPVAGYDPIEFTLTKECGYTQERENDSMRGWATFGIVSCIFIVLSSLLCCGGFIYKTRVEHQYGLHALPGMNTMSAFLDVVGRPRCGNHASQASWENGSASTPAAQKINDRRYGTV